MTQRPLHGLMNELAGEIEADTRAMLLRYLARRVAPGARGVIPANTARRPAALRPVESDRLGQKRPQ